MKPHKKEARRFRREMRGAVIDEMKRMEQSVPTLGGRSVLYENHSYDEVPA